MLLNNLLCSHKIIAYVKFCACLSILNSQEICVFCFYDIFALICTVCRPVDPQLQLKDLDAPKMQIVILLCRTQTLPEIPLFLRDFFYNANRKRYFPEIQFLEMPKLFKTGGWGECVCLIKGQLLRWSISAQTASLGKV